MPKCFSWCKCNSRKGKKRRGKGLVDDDDMYNEGAIPLIGGTLESNATVPFQVVHHGTPEPVLTLGDFYCLSNASTGSTCPSTIESQSNLVNLDTLEGPDALKFPTENEAEFKKVAANLVASVIRSALLISSTELYVGKESVLDSDGEEQSETLSVDEEAVSIMSEPDIPEDVAVTNFVSNLLSDVIENIQRKLFDKKAVGENYTQIKTATLQSNTSTYTDVDSLSTQNTAADDATEDVDKITLEWDDNDIPPPLFCDIHHPPPITLVFNQDG